MNGKRSDRKNAPGMRTVCLLLASVLLLLGSTVGSTRAALTYYSENYGVEVEVSGIGVSLLEKGAKEERVAAWRNSAEGTGTGELLADLPAGEELVLDRAYPEELRVKNTGEIDSYVRVILWKSWKNAKGEKDTRLSPELIDLELNLSAGGWVKDPAASTKERSVFYYKKALAGDAAGSGEGGVTEPLCRSIRIDPALREQVEETVVSEDADGSRTIRTVYAYDGCSFEVKAEVDAVQARSAAAAVKSAWGVDVEIAADGTLTLPGESSALTERTP